LKKMHIYTAAVVALVLLALTVLGSFLVPAEAQARTITVAVDLAHGESSKYLDYIMGNITFVNWKILNSSADWTEENLADVDVILIGQPTKYFSDSELKVLKSWFDKGNKIVWIAGDSDYGSTGPVAQDIANILLELLGSKLRIDLGAIYDDVHNAGGAYYRVLVYVKPDPRPDLYTDIIAEGITKPLLAHGPSCVVWVDENGVWHDSVKDTFPNLIRIVWFYDTARFAENNPPSSYVYDPAEDINRPFVFLAAEYMPEKNNLVVASGESPYGDYEPTWASVYYGVQLDGPRFVTNMIRWFVKLLTAPPTQTTTTPTAAPTTVTMTVTQTQTVTRTLTETKTVTYTTVQTSTITESHVVTETLTKTATVEKTLTTTATAISTTTTTQSVIDLTTTAIAAIIALIIGFGLGYILRRPSR